MNTEEKAVIKAIAAELANEAVTEANFRHGLRDWTAAQYNIVYKEEAEKFAEWLVAQYGKHKRACEA